MLKFLRDLLAGGDTLGIDLGTTNTVCSVLDDGNKPLVVQTDTGSSLIPSVVAWTKNGVLVGEVAARQATTNPAGTVYSAKRFMGKEFSEIGNLWQAFPFVIRPGYEKKGIGFEVDNGRLVTPQEVGAEVLLAAKKAAESRLGRAFKSCVVTVPAYFNDKQRQATKDACAIAGLDCVGIINEPTAAALAFANELSEKDKTILIFDLGGGTFDVSILDIQETDITVKATGGDNFLGGDNFDESMMAVVLQAFHAETGVNLGTVPEAVAQLKQAVVKAKVQLSMTTEAEINLPFITVTANGPLHLNHKFTRTQFEALIMPMVDRALAEVKRTVEAAGLKPSDIDRCLLVGGSTRIPLVQKRVEEYFKKAPLKNFHTDEVVAMGAALFAAMKRGKIEDMVLHDVTSMSLGVQTYPDGMKVLIPKDSPIPCEQTQHFTTIRDNQEAANILIFQGEDSTASKNVNLGMLRLEGIKKAEAGKPKITITYRISEDGILSVDAADESGNQQSVKLVNVGKLSKEEVKRMATETALPAPERKQLLEARRELAEAIQEYKEEVAEVADPKEKQTLMVKVEEAGRVLQEEISVKKIEKEADGIREYVEEAAES